MSLAKEALQFLRITRSGVLSTFCTKFEGYPFGSVAPFILNHSSQPIVLISTIAEHTKNIIANPKVSLLVFAGDDDLQANARLTLIGDAKQIDKEDADLRARYLRYFPQAVDYFEMHDFNFYRIDILHVRYIAGFGKMGWLAGNEFFSEAIANTPNLLASQETAIIEHMNAGHIYSMLAYCKHFHDIDALSAKMLGIDCDGFDVKVEVKINEKAKLTNENSIVRFNFNHPVYDAQSARIALVEMSKLATPKS